MLSNVKFNNVEVVGKGSVYENKSGKQTMGFAFYYIVNGGKKNRKVLQLYSQEFLDKNMYVALALAIVSYTLWCVDPITIQRIGNDYLFWTIPLLMIILQLYSLNIEGNSYGDPIDVILSDKKLLTTIIVYILVIGGILYLL